MYGMRIPHNPYLQLPLIHASQEELTLRVLKLLLIVGYDKMEQQERNAMAWMVVIDRHNPKHIMDNNAQVLG